jgi:PAS domain S-box-containing protein
MVSDPGDPRLDPLTLQTAGAFRMADDRLRAGILDALGEATIAVDPEGRIIYWNDAATALYGWRPEEVMGARILDITPSEGLREAAGRILETVRRGDSWSGEFRVQDRAGREFPVTVTDSPVLDADGELRAIVGVSRDISGEEEAERALRESQDRLRLVRRAVPSVVWEFDSATGRLEWSDALTDLFGWTPEQVEPTLDWWRARVHPEDRVRVDHSRERFLDGRGQFWTEEYRFRRADGSYAEVFDRAFATVAEPGHRASIAGAMVDLTERRQLQDERRLMAQASMILDLSLDYEATLPTLVRLVATTLADFCLVMLRQAVHVPAFAAGAHSDPGRQGALEALTGKLPDRIADESPIARSLRDGEPVLIRDVPEVGRADGWSCPLLQDVVLELLPETLILVPVRARSDIFGFMLLGNGPDRPGFGGAEMRVAEELGRRIGTAVDHARMYQAERLASRAKANFLAVVSHELRTPLTAVLGYADLLAGQVSGPLNAQQLRQVRRIRAGTDRLHRLIESILGYVRLETGAERPQPSVIRVDDLVDRIRSVIEPRAVEDGTEFQVRVGTLPETLNTDGDWLTQIVLALLTNALKFAREGTVELRLEARDGRLEVFVTDSGPGIPEEHQPYVFNPFWQVEQPSTRRAGGAGLGLSVARRLARLLGGDVVIAGSSTDGTTFRLTLPTEPPP